MNDGGVVLQLVVVLHVGAISHLIPSACERSEYGYSWLEILRRLIVVLTEILEAGFVHNIRAQDLGVADLQGVLGGVRVVSLRRKRKLSDSLVVFGIPVELIADGQVVERINGDGSTMRLEGSFPIRPNVSWVAARVLSELLGAPLPPHVRELIVRGRTADGSLAEKAIGVVPDISTADIIKDLFEWATVTYLRPSTKDAA